MCLKWLFFIYDRKAERFILDSLSYKKIRWMQEVRWTSALRRLEWNGDRTAAEDTVQKESVSEGYCCRMRWHWSEYK